MRTACIVALLACVFAAQGFAQNSKLDIFGGYSYLRANPSGFLPAVNTNGWEASATYNFSGLVGLTADVDGHYCCAAHMYDFLAGPQFTFAHGTVVPFLHGLAGVTHGTQLGFDHTVFAYVLGGGMDVRASDRLYVRIGQFDYLATHFSGATQRDFRYSVGLVFRLGKR